MVQDHHLELEGEEFISEPSSESSISANSDRDDESMRRSHHMKKKTRRECFQEGIDLLAGNDMNNRMAWFSFVISWVASLFGIFQPFDDVDVTYRMFIFLVVLFLFNQSFFLVKILRDAEVKSLKNLNGRVSALSHFMQGALPGHSSFDRILCYVSYVLAIAALVVGLLGMAVVVVPQQETGGLVDKNPGCWMWAAAGECSSNPTYMNEECALSCSNPGGVGADVARWYTRIYMALSIMFTVSSSLNLAMTLRDKLEAAVYFEEMTGRHVMSKRCEIAAHNCLDALNKHQGMFAMIFMLIAMGAIAIMVFTMIDFGLKEKGIGLLSAAMFMCLASSWNFARVLDENKGHTDATVYVGFLIAVVLGFCAVWIPDFRDKMERVLFILGLIIVMDSTFHVAKVFHRGERVARLSKQLKNKFHLDFSNTEHTGQDESGGSKDTKKPSTQTSTAKKNLHPTAGKGLPG